MSPDEYESLDALGMAALVARGDVTPSELVELAIDRIERRNPTIHAVIETLYDRARADASGPLPPGPFRGVPFLLKDGFAAYAGARLSSGSRFYADYRPAANSHFVERLVQGGLVVLGKTNLPELALLPVTEPEAFGPTRNPYDLGRSPGGSSGGSAAAVAARMVPMASGGDGGGSIRMPASCCGLFGFKPSRGRVPTGPFEASAWEGFSTEHVLCRSVRDSAAFLDVTAGPAVGDLFQMPAPDVSFLGALGDPPGKLRIAYSYRTPLAGGLAPDCRDALDHSVRLLEGLGHELVEANLDFDGRTWKRTNAIMMAGIVAADVRDAVERVGRPESRDDFERSTWLLRALGEAFTAGDYAHAMRVQYRFARQIAEFVARHDAWLTPTLAKPPPPIGWLSVDGVLGAVEGLIARFELGGVVSRFHLSDRHSDRVFDYMPYTMLANAAGLPSMSVPLYRSRAGLPIGTMLTGSLGADAPMLRLAAQLERASPWADHRPPLS